MSFSPTARCHLCQRASLPIGLKNRPYIREAELMVQRSTSMRRWHVRRHEEKTISGDVHVHHQSRAALRGQQDREHFRTIAPALVRGRLVKQESRERAGDVCTGIGIKIAGEPRAARAFDFNGTHGCRRAHRESKRVATGVSLVVGVNGGHLEAMAARAEGAAERLLS